MAELTLAGLDGANPLGFMAGLGVLVALRERRERGQPEPRLYWRNEGLWRPVVRGVDSVEALSALLAEDLSAWREAPALDLRYEKKNKPAHDLKPPPARFRQYLSTLLDRDADSGRGLDYAIAFGTETATDNNQNVKPTALHFTAGQQEFLAMVQQLVEGVTQDDLLEAVRGPWRYARPLPVLQWDSTAARFYALRASDPSTDKKLGVPGADWLAFRALSLLPCAPVGERIVTTGCGGGWKSGHFTWPLWTVPTSVLTTRSLLGMPSLLDMPPAERKARGIGAVLRSRIRRSDQRGYGSFTPASVV